MFGHCQSVACGYHSRPAANDHTQMMSFPAPGAAALSLMVNSAADAISNMTQVSLDLMPLSVTSWWTSQKISLRLTLCVSQRLKIHAGELLVDARNASAAFLIPFITFQDSQRSIVRRRGSLFVNFSTEDQMTSCVCDRWMLRQE